MPYVGKVRRQQMCHIILLSRQFARSVKVYFLEKKKNFEMSAEIFTQSAKR